MIPSPAVVVNLDQATAFESHSKLSLKKVSLVVPQLIIELDTIVAVWRTEILGSNRPLKLVRRVQKAQSSVAHTLP